MPKVRLSTFEAVMVACGGPQGLARLTDRSPQTIAVWKLRGQFPLETFLIIRDAVSGQGYELDHGDLFAFQQPAPTPSPNDSPVS